MFRAHHLFSQSDIVEETALTYSAPLSQEYEANVYIKREDHQRGNSCFMKEELLKLEGPIFSTLYLTKTEGSKGL